MIVDWFSFVLGVLVGIIGFYIAVVAVNRMMDVLSNRE